MNIKQMLINKKILAIGVVIAVTLIVVLSVTPKAKEKLETLLSTTPVNMQNQESSLKVAQIDPDPKTILVPNQKQPFTIVFNKPVSAQEIQVTLRKQDVTKRSSFSNVEIRTSIIGDNKTLVITPFEAIQPLTIYKLEVIHVSSNNKLVDKYYASADLRPTPVSSNNLELIPYLPKETDSYRLSYDSQGNVYIFNFKYNPDSQDTLQTQYDKAKNAAISFIESKGVEVNTLTIEWNYR